MTYLVAQRSRFEVDLDRARNASVYRCAQDAQGLDIAPRCKVELCVL